MSQCCFICNNSAKVLLRYSVSLFGEHNTLQSGRKLSEVVGEIVGKTIEANKVHANILCKKCFNSCAEYDATQVRLNTIKKDLLYQFKLSLPCHHLKYENYEKNFENSPQKPKQLVLPASKLQPIPPDLMLKVGKLVGKKLTVSQGNKITTSTIKLANSTSLLNNAKLNTSLDRAVLTTVSEDSASTKYYSEFLSNAVITKLETSGEDDMEIDKDCASLSMVPVSSEMETIESPTKSPSNVTEFLTTELPNLSDETQKYILSKVQILSDGDDDDDEQHTIVVDSDNTASILRMVSGQKLVYCDAEGEISVLMPDDDSQGDQLDHGDGQDSNDESQIELQVSGDEETANAIIAAAQEQGGAFIKVESGEMFRVKSVQSTTDNTDMILQMVEQDGDSFRCMLCKKDEESAFTGNADLMMKHLKTEHDARIYICQLCGAVMRKRTDYSKHITEHLETKTTRQPLRCEVCGKTYNSKTLLAEHSNIHTGHRPYVCQLCNKTFASKYTHQAHMKTHSIRPRPFKCGQCGKSFLTQQNLTQHEKTHSGVKDFVCKVCGERPFSCDICGAAFTQRSNLHSHRRATHLDDKRYHCHHCDKKFKRRRLLEYHIKSSHTGERPLKCSMCPSSFVYPEHYKKHIRIHSGERPYPCEICGKSFNSRDNRNTHRFVHSDKKPYECVTCGAGFMRKQLLYAHMNTSGHLAESIVINQPRVVKVSENEGNFNSNEDKVEQLFQTTELETSDMKPGDKPTLTLIQDSDDPTLLTIHNLDGQNMSSILDAVDADQTEIVTNNENGDMVRLVQVKLPDGNSGWLATDNCSAVLL